MHYIQLNSFREHTRYNIIIINHLLLILLDRVVLGTEGMDRLNTHQLGFICPFQCLISIFMAEFYFVRKS